MNEYDDDSLPVQHVVLEKLKIHAQKRISEEFMGVVVREYSVSHAIDVPFLYGDRIGSDIILQFEAFVLGREEYKSDLVRYPFDWVQALKERFAPVWLLERWPMRYRVIKMDVSVHWPTLSVMVPDHEPVLRYTRNEEMS